MSKQVAVVTGANAGMGNVIASALAEKGYTLVMICRDPAKGEAAQNEIKRVTKNPNVHLLTCDLSSMQSIRHAAETLKITFPHMDVLVNNAGAIFDSLQWTSEGYEKTFATNHLSYFLLTHLLLENLKAAPQARIVNMASRMSNSGRLNWDDLQASRKFSAAQAYANTKLMNIMFTFELAERLKGTQVVANALHPGMVHTNFGSNMTGFVGWLTPKVMRWGRTPAEGADTAIWLASAVETAQITGQYFYNRKLYKAPAICHDPEARELLWHQTEELLGLALK